MIMKDYKEYILYLLEAMRNVEKKYYERKNEGLLERPYCYELYHQFRLLQSEDCSLILNAEPSKKYPYYENDSNKCKSVSPDFVLHKGLEDYVSTNQIMAIEVKQESNLSNGNLENDIEKLQRYISSLFYKFGIFIAVGVTRNKLENLLEKIDDKVLGDFKDKIYFIATESLEEGAFTKQCIENIY